MNRLNDDAGGHWQSRVQFWSALFGSGLKRGQSFPDALANIIRVDRGKARPFVVPGEPKRRFKDILGHVQQVQIGIVGATPPQVMNWDRDKLIGKLEECAIMAPSVRDGVAEVKADGADNHHRAGPDRTGLATAGKMMKMSAIN